MFSRAGRHAGFKFTDRADRIIVCAGIICNILFFPTSGESVFPSILPVKASKSFPGLITEGFHCDTGCEPTSNEKR